MYKRTLSQAFGALAQSGLGRYVIPFPKARSSITPMYTIKARAIIRCASHRISLSDLLHGERWTDILSSMCRMCGARSMRGLLCTTSGLVSIYPTFIRSDRSPHTVSRLLSAANHHVHLHAMAPASHAFSASVVAICFVHARREHCVLCTQRNRDGSVVPTLPERVFSYRRSGIRQYLRKGLDIASGTQDRSGAPERPSLRQSFCHTSSSKYQIATSSTERFIS
jgi:hypothetical protein